VAEVRVRIKEEEAPAPAFGEEWREILRKLVSMIAAKDGRVRNQFAGMFMSDRDYETFRGAIYFPKKPHSLYEGTLAVYVEDEKGAFVVLNTRRGNPPRARTYVVGVDDSTGKLFTHPLPYDSSFETPAFLERLTAERVRELMGFNREPGDFHLAKERDVVRVQGDLAFRIVRIYPSLKEVIDMEVKRRVDDLIRTETDRRTRAILRGEPAGNLPEGYRIVAPGLYDALDAMASKRMGWSAFDAIHEALQSLETAFKMLGDKNNETEAVRRKEDLTARRSPRKPPSYDVLKDFIWQARGLLEKAREELESPPKPLGEKDAELVGEYIADAASKLDGAELALFGKPTEVASKFIEAMRDAGLGEVVEDMTPDKLLDFDGVREVWRRTEDAIRPQVEREIWERDAERIRQEVSAAIRDHEMLYVVHAGNHTVTLAAVNPFEAGLRSVQSHEPHSFLIVRPQTIVLEHPEHGRREVPVGGPMVIAIDFLRRHQQGR